MRWPSPASASTRAHLLLASGCAFQVLVWGLGFGLNYSAPEIDSAEQFIWAFSLENGYWKHPPLPSWIMHGLLWLFGPSVALPFVATQCAIVIALAIVWRLGCEFVSPARAWVAVALTSLVTYHNLGGDCFNHNTVLLPFQAATVLFFYKATQGRSLRAWIACGLFAGLAVLVKYVALFQVLGLLLCFALDRRLHGRGHLAGLCLAAGVFGLVLLPHGLWLQTHDFLPFHYARSVARATGGMVATLSGAADFVLIQLIRCTPFLAAAAFVCWRRPGDRLQPAQPARPAQGARSSDTRFLWIAALSPLVGTLLVAIVSGTELQSRWGANGFMLIGLLAVSLLPKGGDDRLIHRTIPVVAAIHVALCVGMTLGRTRIAEHFEVRTRANFPGAELAQQARETWSRHVAHPLRLVVSDIWLGGNLVANAEQRLAVLIDGRHFKSPWVSDAAVRACGVLILDDLTPDRGGRNLPNPALDALMARAEWTGVWTLRWARPELHPPGATRGEIRWGIVLPQEPDRCPLQ